MNQKFILVNDSSVVLNSVSSTINAFNQEQMLGILARENWEKVPRSTLKNITEKHLTMAEDEDFESGFMKTYRLSQREFSWFCANLGTFKRLRWDIRIQALVFIEWLKSKAHLEQIGRIFDMPTTTTHNSVNRILAAVLKLGPQLIRLPETCELNDICDGFYQKSGDARFLRNVVGAIDGSLVNLIVPEDQMEAYFDRHLNTSMNLTAICDHNMAIRFLYVGRTGACHDANVLKETSIYKQKLFPPQDFVILGDSAYPNCLEPITIIAPYKRDTGNQLLPPHRRDFNYIHSRARTVIERAYGRIKNMWRRIHLNILESNVSKAADIITACIIMNNITLGMHEFRAQENQRNFDFWETEPKPNTFPDAKAYRDYYALKFVE